MAGLPAWARGRTRYERKMSPLEELTKRQRFYEFGKDNTSKYANRLGSSGRNSAADKYEQLLAAVF